MQGNSSPRAMRKVRALRFFRCIVPESTNFAYKGNHLKIKSDYDKGPPARHLSSELRNIVNIFDDICSIIY
jgi:hypothetical protein